MALTPGTRLGPYEIAAPLGAGGMGEVYRARDTRLGRDVAIKVLPQHLSADLEVRTRFEREAKTVSSLNHPHICTLFDVGREGDTDYLVMELVDGETLAQRLARGALPLAQVLKLGAEIAEALDRAHRAGVVHRDLKPGNVMLTKSGAKLMDFGLARTTGPVGAARAGARSAATMAESPTMPAPLTAEGTLVGTFQYMSPEQLEGRESDTRSDLWALGCVLYEMATGRQAFAGESQASLIAAILKDQPRPIDELAPLAPTALDRLVRQCLAKDPDERWQNPRDLMHALRWIEDGVLAAGGAAAMEGSGAAVSAPARPDPSFRQLTFRRGTIMNARFAPDGQTVLYSAAWDGGPSKVFVTRLESPDASELPLPPAGLLAVARSGEIALSVGRRVLGTAWGTTGMLAQVPFFGGAPRELLSGVHEADWLPDGRGLAILRRVGLDATLEFPIGKPLYSSPGWKSSLRVSPDGRRAAFFELFGPGGNVLSVVDRDGNLRALATLPSLPAGLAWRADGREIWFMEWGAEGSKLSAVNLEGEIRVITRSFGGKLNLHDLSPAMDALVSYSMMNVSIACLPPGEERERELAWFDMSIVKSLSADGRTLLFDEQGFGVSGEPQVFVRKTDGSPPIRLGWGIARGLSPDGRWAIVAQGQGLVLLPTGPGEARTLDLSPVRFSSFCAWHPDGDRIVFQGDEKGHGVRLYILALEGGPPRPITPEGVGFLIGATSVPVSPDGTRVLALAGGNELRIYEIESGVQRASLPLEEDEEPIGWSADGRSIFLWRRGDVPVRTFRMDGETGARTQVNELMPRDPAGVVTTRSVMLTPDATVYAYSYIRQLSELFLVRGLA